MKRIYFLVLLLSCFSIMNGQRRLTEEQWDTLSLRKPTVVIFYADWCAPSKKELPIMAQMTREFPEIDFYKVNINQEKDWFEDVTEDGATPLIKFYYLFDDRNYVINVSSVPGFMPEYELRDSCRTLLNRFKTAQQKMNPPLRETTSLKDTLIEIQGEKYHLALQGAVDLGLSVKWAAYNVGAKRPEQNGSHYAWAETTPKSTYTDENCRYATNQKSLHDSRKWQKYSRYEDRCVYLDATDDAATVHWGGKWRMPTEKEAGELVRELDWCWEKIRGVIGIVAYNKTNKNAIFFPMAGTKIEAELYDEEWNGYYWTLELLDRDMNSEYCNALLFDRENNQIFTEERKRYLGFTIRPVYEE